jgi:thymidylate synthase
MHLISARNPHEALPIALDRLFKLGVERETRNGKVLQLRGPTLLCYERPTERVVFWPERDANPIFHALEAMWMLAGRSDVEFVAHYAKRMSTFSDDGKTLNGAYGFRWRTHFGYDQLELICKNLKRNPNDRRQVLTMWDATSNEDFDHESDLQKASSSKDVPCNTHIYFAINDSGHLDMTVCNRSNDLVWGCLGANAVHFSFLQECMAIKIGVPVGCYYQFTNNLHGYLETIEPLRSIAGQYCASPYELGEVKPLPLIPDASQIEEFEEDLQYLQIGGFGLYSSFFFVGVVAPMQMAHEFYKAGDLEGALKACDNIVADDWSLACREWIQRRINRRAHCLKRAQDDGVNYEA